MGKKYIVKLDDDAQAGLEDGRYKHAKGGIIDAKTKRYVRKYEYTGVAMEEGDAIIPCVTAKKIEAISDRSVLIENALARNLEYSRESAVLGLYNFQLSYEKFADISCKLDDLTGSVHAFFMQQKRTKYRKCMMNLKSVYAALMRPETTIDEFQFSTVLNEVASFIQELFEDYGLGKLDREEGAVILINIAIALQKSAEELYVYSYQKYKSKPASYNDWIDVVDLVLTSVKIDRVYHDKMYFDNPGASTSYIEKRARLPRIYSRNMKIETNKKIRFIEDTDMTRAEYLGDPRRKGKNEMQNLPEE